MTAMILPTRSVQCLGTGLLVALAFTLAPHVAGAKTPDGMPPSEEALCDGLAGAAFGLCNAYCEAQDCDVHPRPSCDQLRENFLKLTGSSIFPCDPRCGDGVLNQPTEQCDPPGSPCPDGSPCTADCTCAEPLVCCDFAGSVPTCADDVPLSECAAAPGAPGPPGSGCDPEFGQCVHSRCCDCLSPTPTCAEVMFGEPCPTGCTLNAPGTRCDAISGMCVPEIP